jgi:uncharacterized protein YkwD
VLAPAVLTVLAACGGGGSGEGEEAMATLTTSAAGLVVLDEASSCATPDFQATLLRQINEARAQTRQCGETAVPATGALHWNDRLFSAAALHADDMARNNYFSHTGLDGSRPSQRVSAAGYSWSSTGENIAAGQNSISAVMAAWLASPSHCVNLMRSVYTEVAVACVLAPAGSTYSRYWTMELARP